MNHQTLTFLRVLKELKPFWKISLLGVLASIFSAGIDAGFTYMVKPLLDKSFVNVDIDYVMRIPWIVLAGITLRGFMGGLSLYFMTNASRSMINHIRQKIFKKLLQLPAKTLDTVPSGLFLSKLLYDAELLAQLSADTIIDIVQNICLIFGFFTVMFLISWQLTSIFLISSPIIIITMKLSSKKFRQISFKAQESMGALTDTASEVISGFREVRMFGIQDFMSQKFKNASEASKTQDLKTAKNKAINVFTVQMIIAIAMTLIVGVAIRYSSYISLTAGTFLSLIVAILQLIKPIKTLASINVNIQKAISGADSVFELLDSTSESNLGTIILPYIKGNLEFKNVYFSYYEDNSNWVLKDFNLHIKPGQTIALVGASGSGKTSLINLLPRFYDVQKGQVIVDGINVKDWEINALRSQFSWVSQQATLFNESILKNIAYGTEDYDETQLWDAIRKANCEEFIIKLPNGIHTLIGENGIQLSGGQRQRIALARAIYKNSPILILDEATSALDNRNEKLIQEALMQFQHQKTMIIIAHRLSTIQFADCIYVIHNGKIVEHGTHQELLAYDGHYANLYLAQHEKKPYELVE